ncbi:MAG: hypothetical protein CMM94_04955 [Rickettsiales bacterium]|nr:hypothetical protein [Rickettsiales bacterium]
MRVATAILCWVVGASAAQALSCLPADMREPKTVQFTGVMQSIEVIETDYQVCTTRAVVDVKQVEEGDIAGDSVVIDQRHWICPQDITPFDTLKTYKLYPATDEGVFRVGMCDQPF